MPQITLLGCLQFKIRSKICTVVLEIIVWQTPVILTKISEWHDQLAFALIHMQKNVQGICTGSRSKSDWKLCEICSLKCRHRVCKAGSSERWNNAETLGCGTVCIRCSSCRKMKPLLARLTIYSGSVAKSDLWNVCQQARVVSDIITWHNFHHFFVGRTAQTVLSSFHFIASP